MNRAPATVFNTKPRHGTTSGPLLISAKQIKAAGLNSFSKDVGTGFNLTAVPARPNFYTAAQMQCCAKDGSSCSCPECRQSTANESIEMHEEEQLSRQLSGEFHERTEHAGNITTNDTDAIVKDLGEGQPLASDIRARMEPAFGMNFSQVRTHTDAIAGGLSNSVNARAFTIGNHVAFGNEEYKPGTKTGDALIAHELAHTIQQKGATHSVDKMETGTSGYDTLETDADNTAAEVVESLWGEEKNNGSGVSQKTKSTLRSDLRLQGKPVAATTIKAVPTKPSEKYLDSVNLHGAPAKADPIKLIWGGYLEFIGWETDGREGVIVQEVKSVVSPAACGKGKQAKAQPLTPRYWEAWDVDGKGNVTPIVDSLNDGWIRQGHKDTKGTWSIKANVYWVPGLDKKAGFKLKNADVPEARDLQATIKEPTNLGKALLTRDVSGSWDCKGTHT